jgi:hypothetical protein
MASNCAVFFPRILSAVVAIISSAFLYYKLHVDVHVPHETVPLIKKGKAIKRIVRRRGSHIF